jgi:hypothetical protein
MNWLRRWEIARLKKQVRRSAATMNAVVDNLDCGHHLAAFISSEYNRAQIRHTAAIARLREIDPEFPAPKLGDIL